MFFFVFFCSLITSAGRYCDRAVRLLVRLFVVCVSPIFVKFGTCVKHTM